MPTDEAYERSLLKKLRLARATLLELAAAGSADARQNERKKRARDAEALALERLKALGVALDSHVVARTTEDAVRVMEREREKRAERAAAAAARAAETSAREGKRAKRGPGTGARCDGVWAMHALAKGGVEGDVGGTCETAAREAAGADAKACGAGIWAATKLATRHDDAESDGRVVRSIARAMEALLRRMVEFEAAEVDARGASGTLWSCATCQRTRAGAELDDVAMRRAVNDAASRLNASASTANAQDAANALWGAAKLRKTLEESCATRLVEALAQSEDAKTEEVSIALWALGTFAGDGWASAATLAPPLVRRAKEMAKKKPRDWSAQAVANAAWAAGKLAMSDPNQDRSDAKQLVSALLPIAKDVKNLSAQGFAHVLQGAGAVVVDNRLLADFSKFAYEGLRSRASKITGADLAAVVEATEVLKLHTSMSHGEKLAKEISDAIERDVNSFDWQTVGRLDVALDGVFQGADATALHATLRKRGIAACDAADESRMDLERGSAEALLAQSIAAPVDEASSSALVVDDGHRLVTKKLRRIGWNVVNWQRFSRGEHTVGTCWPEALEDGSFYAAAVVRLPPTKASLSMILHATAAHVQFGAPVWIYGAVTEGLRSVIADLPTVRMTSRFRFLALALAYFDACSSMRDVEGRFSDSATTTTGRDCCCCKRAIQPERASSVRRIIMSLDRPSPSGLRVRNVRYISRLALRY